MRFLHLCLYLVVIIYSKSLFAETEYKTHGYKKSIVLEIFDRHFTEYREYDRKTKLLKEIRHKSHNLEVQRLFQDSVEYQQTISLYTEKSIQRLVFQGYSKLEPLKLVLYKHEPYRIWFLTKECSEGQFSFIKQLTKYLSENDKKCEALVKYIQDYDYENISDCVRKEINKESNVSGITAQMILNKIQELQDEPRVSCSKAERSSVDIKTGNININPKDDIEAALLEELVHLSGVGFHTCNICDKDAKCEKSTEENVGKVRDIFRKCPSNKNLSSGSESGTDSNIEVNKKIKEKIASLSDSAKATVTKDVLSFLDNYLKPILMNENAEKYLTQFLQVELKDKNDCHPLVEKLISIHKDFCNHTDDCLLKISACMIKEEYQKLQESCESDVRFNPTTKKPDAVTAPQATSILPNSVQQAVVSTAPGETKSGVFPESAGGRSGFNFPTPKSLDSFKNNFGQVVSGLGGSAFSGPSNSKGETVLLKSTDAGSALSSKPTYSYPKGNGALDIQFSKNPNLLASNTTGLPAGLDSSRFNGSVTGSATSGTEKMGAAQIQSKGGVSPAPKSGGSVGSSANGATDVGDVQFGGNGAGVRMPAAAQAQAQAKTRSSASEKSSTKKSFSLDELKNKASVDDCKSYAQSLADNVSIRCGGKPASEEKPGSSYYNFEVVNGIRKVQKWDPMSKKWKDTP